MSGKQWLMWIYLQWIARPPAASWNAVTRLSSLLASYKLKLMFFAWNLAPIFFNTLLPACAPRATQVMHLILLPCSANKAVSSRSGHSASPSVRNRMSSCVAAESHYDCQERRTIVLAMAPDYDSSKPSTS